MENYTKAFFISLAIYIAMLIPLILLYFLPSIIALNKKDKNIVTIIIINLFLGWTVIGWIFTLIWVIKNKI